MRRIVVLKSLRTQDAALQRPKSPLEPLAEVPARLNHVLILEPMFAADNPKKHQRALDQSTLGPVLARAVHPDGCVSNLLMKMDAESLAQDVQYRRGAVQILFPIVLRHPGLHRLFHLGNTTGIVTPENDGSATTG
jgi:hypothetical protein